MKTTVLIGDVRERLRDLPERSVQCVVTSPPYFGLRDYGVEGQIGLESSVEAYVAALVRVFAEVKRVLRDDGTLWLNLGDSYAANRGSGSKSVGPKQATNSGSLLESLHVPDGLKPKDLIGVPWRVAFALQADGWWLRSEITWAKKAPMPESVRDRPTSATEKIFLLTKSARYYYDAIAVAEKTECDRMRGPALHPDLVSTNGNDGLSRRPIASTRNQRNFWLLGPEPFPDAHFATFVTEVPRRAILAGTSEKGACAECGAPWVRMVEQSRPTDYEGKGIRWGNDGNGMRMKDKFNTETRTTGWQPSCSCDGTFVDEPYSADDPERTFKRFVPGPGGMPTPVPCVVLDPFGGAGTVSLVASRLGRDSIYLDLKAEYAEMSMRRWAKDGLMFHEIAVMPTGGNPESLTPVNDP